MQETSKTWDLCIDMLDARVRSLAVAMGNDAIAFLKAFKGMQDGFARGSFRFTILIAEKPTPEQKA